MTNIVDTLADHLVSILELSYTYASYQEHGYLFATIDDLVSGFSCACTPLNTQDYETAIGSICNALSTLIHTNVQFPCADPDIYV